MGCFTETQLHSLLRGTLPPEEREALLWERAALLEHALACEACAERLWQANAALPAASPPPGLEQRVLEAAHAGPRQESLRAYTLRVVAAMAAALTLLFTGAFQKLAQLPQDLPEISQTIRTQITIFVDSTKAEFQIASKPK